jgi:hypothetical protein
MADLGFIPLFFWDPNTVLVIHWRCGPVLGTQGGDLCPLLYSLVGILCSSYGYASAVAHLAPPRRHIQLRGKNSQVPLKNFRK